MSQNSLQRGNELSPVIPGFILVIPAKEAVAKLSPAWERVDSRHSRLHSRHSREGGNPH
ncbi:hypothetical protein [Endozoicomonas sp. 8E]|uniref:hypothetical protein n=1 Tax=Endozoicomonas sp. 8E TaxID=3035692 RepID=UPI00293928EF|nr:hypothetical protein [Endozoicomonas sp. 8E]WOG29568.1 hypothetical protein P6910_07930 [Endozoicomonas sp. 8E]